MESILMPDSANLDRRQLLQTVALAGIGFSGLQLAHQVQAKSSVKDLRKGFFNSAFGDVYFQQSGTGPELLLIHQSAQTSQEYSAVLPLLSSEFRVTVLDLPGHGHSDTPPRELSMQDYSDTIIKLLDHLKIPKTHIVGNHGGAALAVDIATRYSSRVVKIVVAGLGRGEELDMEAMKNTPMTRDLPVDPEGEFLTKTWAVYRKMSAKTTPPEITFQPFLASLQQRLRPYDMHHAAYRWDYYEVIDKLDKPALFLKAEEDVFSGDTKALASMVKGSQFNTISQSGVWIFLEQPGQSADLIKEYLAG
jgi:pimeloyl-ACP methyl ester carboxylesterase